MADVSARIRVVADASEAKKVVNETAADVEKMKESAERAQAAASGAAGGAMPATGKDAQRMIAEEYRSRWGSYKGPYQKKQPKDPDEDPKAVGRAMAEAFSRVAGSALAKFVVGYMANQGVGTAFELMRRQGRDNSRVDQAEATVQGAIQWGAAGAQIAGPLGGVVGSLLGGLNSFILKEKQIRDAIKEEEQSQKDLRKQERWSQNQRMSDMVFRSLSGNMTPEERAQMLRDRASEMSGGGESGRAIFKRYKGLYRSGTDADMDKHVDMLMQFEEALEAELHNGGKDAFGRRLSVGGNEAGTKEFYELMWRFSMDRYGKGDRRTAMMKDRLAAMNSRIDPAREEELGIYLGEIERYRGLFAGRSAITDSASSKGLGVGAQIGAMQNERVLREIDRVVRAIQLSGEKSVDAIRAAGGVGNVIGSGLL